MPSPRFSIIIPVYNRPGEMADLMAGLDAQTLKDFELIVVEDGSTVPCREVVEAYVGKFPVRYFAQENKGRSIARNVGMEQARGAYLLFFDSDCILPPDYIAKLSAFLDAHPYDCFGGPDAAHPDFSPLQKAISFAMTSMLTTGGIRGRARSMERFVPRTFNMGFSREVYSRVGGFKEMFSEDIDMSTRIRNAGFSVGLYPELPVYHKRRLSLRKFFRQVYVFGMSRISLHLLYPGSMKLVHALPALAVVIGLTLLMLGIFVSPWWLLPIGLYLAALFVSALVTTRSLRVALLALPASVIQICGYGTGFIRAWVWSILLGHGRNLEAERRMRAGK